MSSVRNRTVGFVDLQTESNAVTRYVRQEVYVSRSVVKSSVGMDRCEMWTRDVGSTDGGTTNRLCTNEQS